MGQLAEQQLLADVPMLALGDVPGALEHHPPAVELRQLDPAIDRQLAAVLGLLLELAAPGAALEQGLPDRIERRPLNPRVEQPIASLPERLLAAIAVQLLAAPVP